MNFIKPITLLLLLSFSVTFSQTLEGNDDKLSLYSGSLDNQFEYVITKSGGWNNEGQSFRVIKTNWLTDLKAHTLDTISAIKKDLIATNITVKAQAQEIADLKASLTTTKQTLTNTKDEKNNMHLFGIEISKSGYSAIMWSIIGVLLVLLAVFIYKFKNSHVITKNAKRALNELEEEFEEHRKTAVEREQKVRRQLQDEINKQKTMKPKK